MSNTDDLKQTISEAASRVTDLVNDAVKSGEFSGLNRDIQQMVKSAGTSLQNAYKRPNIQSARAVQAERVARERQLAPYFMPPASSTGNKIVGVVGTAGAVLSGAVTAATGLMATLFSGALVAAGFFGLLTAGCAALAIWQFRAAKNLDRFNQYRFHLSGKLYADIPELAQKMRLPEQTVVKDLKRMTRKGLIRQGHFDREERCFIASDDLYHQYLLTEQQAAAQKQLEDEKQQAIRALDPQVKEVLDQGNSYLTTIHSANDAIEDPVVSQKLSRMEGIVRHIFEEVQARPALAANLSMFMNYYLPTTVKLLDAYRDLVAQPVQGEHITAARREIEGSLDTINDAFESLLDGFFRDKALDVSSDISVMKTMMKQDGLTADELDKMRSHAGLEKEEE
jgi:5-bromo-4-chloroindolyl phosphate hydrolysis protein